MVLAVGAIATLDLVNILCGNSHSIAYSKVENDEMKEKDAFITEVLKILPLFIGFFLGFGLGLLTIYLGN